MQSTRPALEDLRIVRREAERAMLARIRVVDRDVVTAKVAAIDRRLQRISETRGERSAVLLPVEIEDIVVLNLQRVVQAAIGSESRA